MHLENRLVIGLAVTLYTPAGTLQEARAQVRWNMIPILGLDIGVRVVLQGLGEDGVRG